MRKDIHIVNIKRKKGICHLANFNSMFDMPETPKYKMSCLKSPKSSWFAICFTKAFTKNI